MKKKPVFTSEFLQELAEACPLGPCSPELVQSWFDISYPKMAQRGYSRWKLAVASWWSRVRDYELERAQDRLDAMADAHENAVLEDLARQANDDPQPGVASGRRFRVVG